MLTCALETLVKKHKEFFCLRMNAFNTLKLKKVIFST